MNILMRVCNSFQTFFFFVYLMDYLIFDISFQLTGGLLLVKNTQMQNVIKKWKNLLLDFKQVRIVCFCGF